MTETTGITRTIEEITASARMNAADMMHRASALGQDMLDAKALLPHGDFGPWLKKTLGLSTSTAANYMRIAREIAPGSRMAQLPYSKALALLAAPADEREELAGQADEKSAAEIRKLIEERNRAAEAANAETARADQAEKDAKRFYGEIGELNKKIKDLEAQNARAFNDGHKVGQKVAWEDINVKQTARENSDLRKRVEELTDELEQKKAELLTVENNRVEVAPADYEDLKRSRDDLLAAAEDAERRAAEAEERLAMMSCRTDGGQEEPWKVIKVAMTRFMADCEMLILDPAALAKDQARIEAYLTRIEAWADNVRIAMAKVTPEAEGAVV